MSRSPIFPLEIFEIIVSYVPDDRSTLLSFCSTSPYLTHTAQTHLFKFFRTDRWANSPPSSSEEDEDGHGLSTAKFLRAVIHKPILGSHVHDFATPFPSTSPPYLPSTDEWLQLLVQALPLMINLKSLSLFTLSSPTQDWQTPILTTLIKCQFQLLKLRYTSPSPPRTEPNSDQTALTLLRQFLTSQPSLHTLSLHTPPIHFLPPAALPNLHTLSSTPSNITSILSTRTVPGTKAIRTLDCVYLDADDQDFEFMSEVEGRNRSGNEAVKEGLKRVERLCLGVHTIWLRNLQIYFQNVQVLQTSITMTREYHLLPTFFPSLKILHITRGGTTPNEQGMMSKWLFLTLPVLRTVIWGSPVPSPSASSGGAGSSKGVAQSVYDYWIPESIPRRVGAREVHEVTGLLLVDKLPPAV
ncbi:hypothetical protein AN958_07257 [Leucoagaricus sp. SymC.cos]|nr:hypothetical protein AN958_07257 [Leucoagaricus sp. SymC.cos]